MKNNLKRFLQSYWKFEEATGGPSIDELGVNNLTWTSIGTNPNQYSLGKINNCIEFDQPTDTIGVQKDTPTINMLSHSVMGWFKLSNEGVCFEIRKDSNPFSRIFVYGDHTINGGTIGWGSGISGHPSEDLHSDLVPYFPVGNIWHHIAYTMSDTKRIRLYVEGVKYVDTHSVYYETFTPERFYIGKTLFTDQSGPSMVDELGIWNKCLSDEEVLQSYNAGVALAYEDFSITDADISFQQITGTKYGDNVAKYHD